MSDDWRGIPEEYRNQIVTGDARELAKRIPDESVDLIFTDPPYPGEYLYLYEWLASEAKRILHPNGFIIAYAGEYHKNKIIHYFDNQLEYFWDIAAVNYQGPGPMIWQRRIISKYKSLLVYRLPNSSAMPRCNVLSVFNGTEWDKNYHAWQQDAATARYYIDCFSGPGDIICDPFMGGGTTAAMCMMLDRRWIGFEVDIDAVARARARLLETQPPLFTLQPDQLELGV